MKRRTFLAATAASAALAPAVVRAQKQTTLKFIPQIDLAFQSPTRRSIWVNEILFTLWTPALAVGGGASAGARRRGRRRQPALDRVDPAARRLRVQSRSTVRISGTCRGFA